MPITTEIFTRMAARTVAVIRENAITPRLINRDYALSLATKGDTVNVPVASPITVRDVVPNVVPPATAEPVPTTVPVTLNNWKEGAFVLNDKDVSSLDVPDSYINKQLEEAGRSVANAIDRSVLGLYKGVYGFVGTPGVTPFATSTIELQNAIRVLNQQLSPTENLKLLLDPFANANAIGLRAFQDAFASNMPEVIREGRINHALGFDWYQNQNILTHTIGATGGGSVSGATAAGLSVISIAGQTASGVGVFVQGDIITFAGQTQTYVVTADANASAGGVAIVNISPPLKFAVANSAAVAITAGHLVNLAFNRDFAAFASRPMSDLSMPQSMGGFDMTWPDPVSGVICRLQIKQQHFQTSFSVSCLWGTKVIRPELAVRIAG